MSEKGVHIIQKYSIFFAKITGI